jgi:hypothetical protein
VLAIHFPPTNICCAVAVDIVLLVGPAGALTQLDN